MPAMEITSKPEAALARALAELAVPGRYVLAYSGGMDSSVLLHALAARAALEPGFCVRAVHVDHALHAESGAWAEFCRAQCAQLGLVCEVRVVTQPAPGGNLEAWARDQRYAELARALQPGEIVLTAHHQRDQAETLLLHLLRGSGLRGLAAMPACRPLGSHVLMRPLLQVDAGSIAAYAKARNLHWLDDPGNASARFDRNFLRHQVLPLLRSRFPAAESNLARSAGLLAEAQTQLRQACAEGLVDGPLNLSELARLDPATRNRRLLDWLDHQGLPCPRHGMLAEIWRQFLRAAQDREPLVRWPGAELRRYRDGLYAMRPLLELQPLRWSVAGQGERAWPYGGIVRWRLGRPGLIRLPQDGDTIVLNAHTRRLKALFQAEAVPPWQRRRMPLLQCGEEIVAVGNLWRAAVASDFEWLR